MSSLRRYRLATAFFAISTAVAGYHAWNDDPAARSGGVTHSSATAKARRGDLRSEEHTSELQSRQ